MAKKRMIAKKIPVPMHSSHKGFYALMGIVLIALGVVLYLGIWNLEIVISAVLVLFGLKKLFMAAKCC